MLKRWIHKTRQTNDKTTEKTTKEEETSTLPAKYFFYIFFGPMGLGETFANFFERIFGVCSRFSRNNRLWTELCNFFWWFPFYHFDILLADEFGCYFFGGLEIKPWESRLEFAHPQKIKKTKKQMTKNGWWGDGKKYQRGRKKYIACKINFFTFFWAYGSRGNSREFLLIHFPSLMDFKGKTQLQDFLGDFHFDILLIVLMICKKNICHFFGGTGHEPKIDVSFGFWSFDFGGLDFGVLILGVWILEFWFWGFGSWSFDFGGLDLGVLILGVWILEFWFWGFGSWSFDFGFWSFDLGVFGLLISFVSFWKVFWVWSGFLGKVLEEMLVRVWGETIADPPVQEPILFLSGVFWEDSWVWSGLVWRVVEGMLGRVWEETIADTIVGKCSWVCSGSRFYLCSVVWGTHQGVWSGFFGGLMGDMIRRVWEKPLQTIHSTELL